MAAPDLAPPPVDTPLLEDSGKTGQVWTRWLQQLRDSVRGIGLPYAAYNTAAAQSIPNATSTVINFGTKLTDTDSAVTTGAAWKFTAPGGKSGLYSVSATGTLNAAAAGDVILMLMKNGVEFFRFQRVPGAAHLLGLSGTCVLQLDAGDYVQVFIFQNSGGALSLEATAAANAVTIAALRA